MKKLVSVLLIKFIILITAITILSACALVPQYKREHLSDPIMQPVSDDLEEEMDSHRFQNREGSTGGSTGAGGGCGC